jgi:hypothetical protein
VPRPVAPAPRLSVQRALAATVLVVAALVAVSLRGQATEHVDITAQTRAAAFAGSRPAVNGASRPALPAAEERAVERLAETSRHVEGPEHEHSGPASHLFGPSEETALTPHETDRFERQWAAAVAAIPKFDTPAKAAAAGYVQSSVPSAGVGIHWVNWELIARPFDPARPSMLLFARERGVDRLVGFSYWVQSASAPGGFAGPNDHWHTHAGLYVVNG